MTLKKIKGYDNYTINEQGEVFSHMWGKLRKLKPQAASQSKKKYYQIRLFSNENKKCKLQYVHRLVWQAFRGEIPKGLEIDHMDGNTSNNFLSNLQLLTRRDNINKYQRETQDMMLRDKRDELINDYEELGTFKEVAKKWGTSLTAVNRVVRNRIHLKINGKYGTKVYDETIKDKWSL